MTTDKTMTRLGGLGFAVLAILLVLSLALGCAGKRTESATDTSAVPQPIDQPAPVAATPTKDEGSKSTESARPARATERKQGGGPEASSERSALPGEQPSTQGQVKGRHELGKAPGYAVWARSLRHYEQTMGVEFYRNARGRYTPYAESSWDSFSIADRSGDCLYVVDVIGAENYKHLEGKREVLLEMDVRPGPCGLAYPKTDSQAMDRVSVMEGTVISPALVDRLAGGSPMCEDVQFLQKVLQVPYRLESPGDDLEQSISKEADRVKNALDSAVGDIVFFSAYPGETTVGIYAGYGLIIYNSCFGARSHQMQTGGNYRIYRLFAGFHWTHYRMHHDRFLQQFVGGPK